MCVCVCFLFFLPVVGIEHEPFRGFHSEELSNQTTTPKDLSAETFEYNNKV